MSKTLKTRSPEVRAKSEGVSLPKIICRRPSRGDTHPVSSRMVRNALSHMPAGYLVGLNRIELCPRGGTIGQPFGKYNPVEKAIYLYSLPMEWDCSGKYVGFLQECRDFGANVQLGATTEPTVRWPDTKSRTAWFLYCVLGHELGHHYRQQDRFRKRRTSRRDEEVCADVHAVRIERAVHASLRKSRGRSD